MRNSLMAVISWIILCALFCFQPAIADSPVTSTDFYRAYMDLDIVKYAKDKGIMDNKIAEFLHKDSTPIDQKAAVINALSWDVELKNNAEVYQNYLHSVSPAVAGRFYPEASDQFCLGYLTLMDDYREPQNAIAILQGAAKRINDSFTVAIVLAIAKSQQAVSDDDWDKVSQYAAEVKNNKALKDDMRSEARDIIFNYLEMY